MTKTTFPKPLLCAGHISSVTKRYLIHSSQQGSDKTSRRLEHRKDYSGPPSTIFNIKTTTCGKSNKEDRMHFKIKIASFQMCHCEIWNSFIKAELFTFRFFPCEYLQHPLGLPQLTDPELLVITLHPLYRSDTQALDKSPHCHALLPGFQNTTFTLPHI